MRYENESRKTLCPYELYWSGRLDLNQRPLSPQDSALPGCATPRPLLIESKPEISSGLKITRFGLDRQGK